MKKNLNEEINRIKHLCSPINNNLLMEVDPLLIPKLGRRFFKGKGISWLYGYSDDLTKAFAKGIDDVIPNIPSGHSLYGMTADDIAKGLIDGTIKGTNLGDLHVLIFKEAGTDAKLRQELAERMVNSKSFQELASKGDEAVLKQELTTPTKGVNRAQNDARKLTSAQADELIDLYKSKGGTFNSIISPTRGKTGGIIGKSLIPKVSIWRLLKFGLIGWGIWEIWKALVNNGETGYPECINQKVTESDVKLMEGKDNEKLGLLIRNTGIKEFDKLGGGRFFQNGKFKTDDGSLEGNWKENSKYGIVINVNGTDNIMSCDGKITTDLEDSIKIEIPKTPLDIEIEKWEGKSENEKWRLCKNAPYSLGCKDDIMGRYTTVKGIQNCLGYKPEDGEFSPDFLKFLLKKGYPKTLNKSDIDKIKKECGYEV